MDVGEAPVRAGRRRDGADLAGDRRRFSGFDQVARQAAFHCSIVAAWPEPKAAFASAYS